jgi:hypothetical protein
MDQIPVLTRAQLGLPEGIGIAVAHVAKGSAAEKASLKVNDIITQLDDQLIINSQQLQTLIHTKKPGDEVTITYLRKGKEHKATAKLTKGPIVVHAPQALRLENGQWQQFNLPNGLGGNEFKFHFNFPGGNQGEQGDNAPNIPNIRKQVMTSITISDNTGAYTLTTKNGKKTFTAKDPDGAESFTGPVDTKKQRDSLDRDLIKKLEQLEGMGAGKGGIQLNRLNLNGGNFKFDKKFEFKIDPRQPVPKEAPKKPRSDA